MSVTDIQEAQAHFSHLLAQAAAGEEVIIARDGKPVARLVKYTAAEGQRHPGRWTGRVHVADDFDEPLPGETDDAFQGRRP